MASWIIGIDKANPQHWRLAQEHGFWDMTRARQFSLGDTLYFWQAGASLLGSVLVTRETYEIPAGTWMPWNLSDAKRADYGYRVEFEVLHEKSASQPSWSELQRNTGVRGATNFGPRSVPAEGERWLVEQIDDSGTLGKTAAESLAGSWWEDSSVDESETEFEKDLRTRIEASIVIRQGQGRFRRSVLQSYEATCCISGSTLEAVLDAAHIAPYRGSHTNRADNALLLRTDLHTLFDRHLLTVTPSGVVRVAPQLRGSEYAAFEGQSVQVPRYGPRPSRASLEHHNQQCLWLEP